MLTYRHLRQMLESDCGLEESLSIQINKNVRRLQKLLGHSHIALTQEYIKATVTKFMEEHADSKKALGV